jgi:hypothetical protein
MLHLLAAASVPWPAQRASLQPGPLAAASGPRIIFIQPPDRSGFGPDGDDAASAVETTPGQPGIRLDEGRSILRIPGFTFDAGKIADRAASLFPFLTRTLSFEPVAHGRRGAGGGLASPFAPQAVGAAKPPLELGRAALQSLLDESWSRRHRWTAFQPIAVLAGAHSPDEGHLPALLRGYEVQNGLQPYVDASIRDPRLWTQLGLAADHADFIDFISRFTSEHPSTRASTELLFLLDKVAQASFDCLVTLLDIDPETNLRWTRETSRDAYHALVTIRGHYAVELARRGVGSRRALRLHYDEARVVILRTILRTAPDGYRTGDARFLIGAIHWRQGRRADARRSWSEISVDRQDSYVRAYSEILTAIGGADGQELDAGEIDRILEAERERWISFSGDRLRQFGHRFDTF